MNQDLRSTIQYLEKSDNLIHIQEEQEVSLFGKIDLLKCLPITTCCARERNPYITAGVLVAKDPETGARNVSMNRIQVKGPGQLMVGMSPSHHLYQLLKKAEARGKCLPVAITIGHPPAVMVATNMYVELGFDELEIAGGLLGEPLKIVPGKTVEIEVPAYAEIVIEGEIDPNRWEDVDDDIDPRDPTQVEWAMATRMMADKDIVVVSGVRTDRSEPLEESMTVAKIGIDATKPYDLPPEMFEVADVPAEVRERIALRLMRSP